MNILCRFRHCFIHYAARSTALCRIEQLSGRGLVQLSNEDAYQIEQLGRRGLVKLSGQDVLPYLQGLITNDISNVTCNGSALYTHFLNHKGRILFDALVCRHSPTVLLVECDILVRDEMIRYLKMYRVRKKVDIEPFNGNVWSLFDDCPPHSDPETRTRVNGAHPRRRYQHISDSLYSENVLAFQDPRIPSLGVRIIASSSTNLVQELSERGIRCVESDDYVVLRYKLGIPEGVREIPIGKCLPMEMNCDYLNGVSFQKGCYIGQELTARTYHTGVVRKRVMPLILSSVPDRKLDHDSVIVTEDDQVVGKLKGIYQNYCIALLRVTETLKSSSKLRVNGISAYTYKPFWWPSKKEDQRENSTS